MSLSRVFLATLLAGAMMSGHAGSAFGGLFDFFTKDRDQTPVSRSPEPDFNYRPDEYVPGLWPNSTPCACPDCLAIRGVAVTHTDMFNCKFNRELRRTFPAKTCYPECPPFCEYGYGYRPGCWRRLPDLNPCPPVLMQGPGVPAELHGPVPPSPSMPAPPEDFVLPEAPGDVAPPAPPSP